ncbi:MAG TPA: TonB-dependent receptor [Polyangiaceae bacterium]|jgi:iron complex outermembrane receptor protein|nr:TonB-dependent receptor [Polyangiaceae bacterium]
MRRGLRGILALTVLASSLVPASAWGDARSEARKHFSAGMEHIGAGRYSEGVEELERAYEILPHPSVRYNIGKAWEDAGELEKAVAAYKTYLESDPEDAQEVRTTVAALEKRIAANRAEAERKLRAPPEPGKPAPKKAPKVPPKKLRKPRPEGPTDIYEERVVTASRQAQSPLDSPNSTTIITRQDIRLSGITRIPELLRRVAGADVMQITGGDANVSMRGLNSRFSNKLLVLINGRSVKNDILGNTFWESLSIDVDQIERIEVVRGPGSSLYGADAFAGVVNIITLEPGIEGPGFHVGYGDHNQAYASGWASQRIEDGAYRVSAGFTRYPRWTREVAPDRVDLQESDADQDLGAQNMRIDARTTYRVAKDKSLELGGGYARTELDLYGIGPFNDYVIDIDSADVSGGYRGGFINVRSNYTLLHAEASQNADWIGHTLYETIANQHAFETDVELQHNINYPKELTHGLLGGVQYRLKSISWNYLIDEPPIEHHVGVFGQYTFGFFEHYALVLSGRLDYVPALERPVPSGRGTFIIKPGESKRQAIKASVANAFRSPTFLESYLDLPIQLTLAGVEIRSQSKRLDEPDFTLDPENILAAELGYLNQLSDDFEVEVGAYYHRITDLVELAPPRVLSLSDLANGIGGLNAETGRYNVGFGGWRNRCDVGHVFGGEVGGRVYAVEGLDVFANYAINYGIDELPDGCLIESDQKTSHHKVNVGTQVRFDFGLEGEVTFHYQTSQVWGEQVATLDGIELQLFDLPDYHLLNGRLGYSFLERRLTLSAVVFNALAGVGTPEPQMHPFGNRIGRRIMGFVEFRQ